MVKHTAIAYITVAMAATMVLPVLATAQTNVGGNVEAFERWTAAESPYIVVDDVVVYSSTDLLLIEPGVTVQFSSGTALYVRSGALRAVGSASEPIVFTSLSGSRGGWAGIYVASSSSADLSYCIVENTGQDYLGVNAALQCYTNDLTMANCTIRGNETNFPGVVALGNGSSPVITDSLIDTTGTSPWIYTGRTYATPTLARNTFSGPAQPGLRLGPASALNANHFAGDQVADIDIVAKSIGRRHRWTLQSGLHRYVVVEDFLTIYSSNDSLTIDPGVTVAFANGTGIDVRSGSLTANGTSADPIVFTSRTGNPGAWGGIYVASSATASLAHCTIGNTGEDYLGVSAALQSYTDDLTVTDCTIQGNGSNHPGVVALGNGSSPVITDCLMDTTGTSPWVYTGKTFATPTLARNTFSGPAQPGLRIGPTSALDGNYFVNNNVVDIDIVARSIGRRHRWTLQSGLHRYVVVEDFLTIYSSNDSLTIDPGVTVAFANGTGIDVRSGSLTANGTSADPIVFTSRSGNPGAWRGVVVASGGTANLAYCIIENTGQEYSSVRAAVQTSTDDLVMLDCVLRRNGADGVYIRNGQPSLARVQFLDFVGNSWFAVRNVGRDNVNAQENYWGTNDASLIASVIFDEGDDTSKGAVDFRPFLTASDLVPVAPGLVAPGDGGKVATPTPLLRWTHPDASLFALELASDDGFTDVLLSEPALTAQRLTVPNDQLAFGQRYTWRVRAWNHVSTGPWATGSFWVLEPDDDIPLPVDSVYTVSLQAGINLVAAPLASASPLTLRDLVTLIGADAVSFIVWYDTETSRFAAYMPDSPVGAPTNTSVVGGMGYLVVMKDARDIVFEGVAWRDPATPSPRLLSSPSDDGTPVLAVTGYALDATGRPMGGVDVVVSNARAGRELRARTMSVGDVGRYVVVFADLSGHSVGGVGDLLRVRPAEGLRLTGHAETKLGRRPLRQSRVDLPNLVAQLAPSATGLLPNYPNPFNPETWIPFELAEESDVVVRVYGMDGGLVRTLELGRLAVGEYRERSSAAYWDGRNDLGEAAAGGVYVVELAAGEYRETRRLVVSK